MVLSLSRPLQAGMTPPRPFQTVSITPSRSDRYSQIASIKFGAPSERFPVPVGL